MSKVSWGKNSKRGRLWAATGSRCVYCGRVILKNIQSPFGDYRTIDHIIPASEGGGHFQENLLPSCFECNAKRNHHWPPSDYAHPELSRYVKDKEAVLMRMPLSPQASIWLKKVSASALNRWRRSAWEAVSETTCPAQNQ